MVRRSIVIAACLLGACSNQVSAPSDPIVEAGDLPSLQPSTCETGEYVVPDLLAAAGKIKTVLSGLALDDAEVAALNADPGALRGLVSGWLTTEQARTKLLAFYRQAFQQEGFDDGQLSAQFGEANIGNFGVLADDSGRVGDRIRANVEQMFPLTVQALVDGGAPFNDVLTTRTFMLTPALMTFLAFQDQNVITDTEERGRPVVEAPEWLQALTLQNQNAFDASDWASAQSYGLFDPASPNFMSFYANDPQLISNSPAGCTGAVTKTRDDDRELFNNAFRFYTGAFRSGFAGDCRDPGAAFTERRPGFLTPGDFTQWRQVTIRAPQDGEETHRFYELDRFRDPNVTEIVLATPRIGFMTTLAFFSIWETNPDNQARVTANQTLITAFNYSIDSSDAIFPIVDDALDGEHADPTTVCYACHRTLDPLRQYFRQQYTYRSSRQTNAQTRATAAGFAWNGADLEGQDLEALANFLAEQDTFSEAWVQKLCFFVNSEPCPESSEQFQAVAQGFRDSNYDFPSMAANLLASPLITGAECIDGTEADNVSISRQRHICSVLENRLDVDVCSRFDARDVVGIIADDGFSRGEESPITLREPSLVTTASYRVICESAARVVVNNNNRYRPGDDAASVPAMVTELLGHPPSDPLHPSVVALLSQHYQDARDAGASRVDALRSVFVAACTSPAVIGVGF